MFLKYKEVVALFHSNYYPFSYIPSGIFLVIACFKACSHVTLQIYTCHLSLENAYGFPPWSYEYKSSSQDSIVVQNLTPASTSHPVFHAVPWGICLNVPHTEGNAFPSLPGYSSIKS